MVKLKFSRIFNRKIKKRTLVIIVSIIIIISLITGLIFQYFTELKMELPFRAGKGYWTIPSTATSKPLVPALPPTPLSKVTESSYKVSEYSETGIEFPKISTIGRYIIYTAYLSLEVDDIDETISKIYDIVVNVNGYVYTMYRLSKSCTITIRVPQDKFFETISKIERLGIVKSKSIEARDVTEEWIDLEARLKNAKEVEKRLLNLLQKAKSIDDILDVERELSRIRELIERLEARLRYLKSRIEYATINIKIIEKSKELILKLPEINWFKSIEYALLILAYIGQGLLIITISGLPIVLLGFLFYQIYKRFKLRIVKFKPS